MQLFVDLQLGFALFEIIGAVPAPRFAAIAPPFVIVSIKNHKRTIEVEVHPIGRPNIGWPSHFFRFCYFLCHLPPITTPASTIRTLQSASIFNPIKGRTHITVKLFFQSL